MKAVTTGESHPPRLPKVVMNPETEPENRAVMSLQAPHSMAEAANLNPAASDNCKSDHVLFAVWLPDHNNPAERPIASHAVARLPRRLPIPTTARSQSHPHVGTRMALATNGAEAQKLAFEIVIPRILVK